jgi:hypothetical protein
MISAARRDELLYESDAALRLVDRAIQEMQVLDEAQVSGKGEGKQDLGLGESGLFAVAAGDATVDEEPDAVE